MSAPRHVTRSAIPGQPTKCLPVPDGAVQAAAAGAAALGQEIADARLWGMLDPAPLTARYDPGRDALMLSVSAPEVWRRIGSPHRVIQWRWGVLREYADGWYDVGWHPDATYHGLEPEWQRRIQAAINAHIV